MNPGRDLTSTSMLLSVLGPLSATTDESTTIALGGPQQQRLLCALAVHCPSPVSKGTLEDLLWPDGAPSANALQAQVSKLRRSIAPVEIIGSSSGYTLDVDRDALDAHHFERLVTNGRDAAAAGDAARAHASFIEALRLWRGVPYCEAADHFVAQAASARLTSLRSTALAGRLETELDVGRVDDAVIELDALVAAEPLDERWWALLARARYRQNRQADALRAINDARRVLAIELGLELGVELRDLESRILNQDAALMADHRVDHGARRTATSTRSRLPQRLSSFIGRSNELDVLEQLVASARLVTLLGPGGSGKTSTAVELARRLGSDPDPVEVLLVELAPLANTSEVLAAMAKTFAVPWIDRTAVSDTADVNERVAEIIGDREVILVVDNCEHVIDEIARLIHTLLSRCGGLRVVATSREPLDIPGENIWSIPPLDPTEAIELFTARAEATGTGFRLDDATRPSIDELLGRLDGLPLAIELAAARLRSMSLADVIAHLDDRFQLLAAGPRTVEPRQQTLRAVVDWSHDLLDETERAVFRRLGVFAGGATIAAAAAVCSDDDVAIADVAGVVERLVLKSLVIAEHGPDGVRVRMLQTLQDYALDRLAEAAETEVVCLRHAHYFTDLVAPAERGLMGPEQSRWITLLNTERENLAVALGNAVAVEAADLAIALVASIGWYFFMVGEVPLGVEWLRDAISCPGRADPRRRALALGMFSWLSVSSPEIDLAAAAGSEAMDMLGEFEDAWTECLVICTNAMTRLYIGEIAEYEALLPLAHDAAVRSGDRWTHALAIIIEAQSLLQVGQVERADRCLADAIDAVGAAGDQFMRMIAVTQAAELAEMRGDYDRAVRALEETLSVADRVGFNPDAIAVQTRLANLEALRGNLDLAIDCHLAVLATDAAANSPWLRAIALNGLSMIARRRGDPALGAQYVDDALAMPRTIAVPVMRTLALTARGYCADQLGDAEGALSLQLRSLATARELGGKRVIANAVEGLAGAHAVAGDGELAAELLGCADAMRTSSGGPMPAAERFDVDRAEHRARELIGDLEFDRAFDRGSSCELESILDRVLVA